MDEGRKRVIAIMASILAARKLSQFEQCESPGHNQCNSRRGAVGRADHGGSWSPCRSL